MIEYDSVGRIAYNPELHDRQGQPWTVEETQYLIDWYNIIGAEEMSLALGRSENTITTRVNRLRSKGLMSRDKNYTVKRLLRLEGKENLIWRVYG